MSRGLVLPVRMAPDPVMRRGDSPSDTMDTRPAGRDAEQGEAVAERAGGERATLASAKRWGKNPSSYLHGIVTH